VNLEEHLPKTEATPFSLQNKRLLVVDSNLDTRVLFTFLFEECGAEVVAVESAAEALVVIQDLKPHLLISDIRLRDEDGYSLIRKVRSLEATQGGHIPAIVVTGFCGNKNSVNDAYASGFQGYLLKPVEPDQLVTTATVLLGLKFAAA
jgi:CheY-like chemotaxis protein